MAEQITLAALEEAAQALADRVEPWRSGGFALVSALQEAPCNHGRVDAFKRIADGRWVAVKRMPNWWMLEGPREFQAQHSKQSERPWHDLAMLSKLHAMRSPHICELLGLFRDATTTYAVTALGDRGDLFSWCEQACAHGPAREEAMRPLVAQLLPAARFLHDAGVCHRDFSVENIVLAGSDRQLQVKVIDFGMAGLGREQGGASQPPRPKGKKIYQAPEVHDMRRSYDAFLSDDFALGVVLYVMAVTDFPWSCTRPGQSEDFDTAVVLGMREFLSQQEVVDCDGASMCQVFSPALLDLMAGLMAPEASERYGVGEACYSQQPRTSALHSEWLLSSSQCDHGLDKHAAIRSCPTNASLSTVDLDSEDALERSGSTSSESEEGPLQWLPI